MGIKRCDPLTQAVKITKDQPHQIRLGWDSAVQRYWKIWYTWAVFKMIVGWWFNRAYPILFGILIIQKGNRNDLTFFENNVYHESGFGFLGPNCLGWSDCMATSDAGSMTRVNRWVQNSQTSFPGSVDTVTYAGWKTWPCNSLGFPTTYTIHCWKCWWVSIQLGIA